jgi:hypothetical protein
MMYGLGRKPSPPDSRDYKLTAYLDTWPDFSTEEKVWLTGPVRDQKTTPHCVGFSGIHWQNAEPVLNELNDGHGHDLYYLCKEIDGDPMGENGSYIRTLAKALKRLGRLDKYAFGGVLDARRFLLTQGPIVFGLDWYEGQFYPKDGTIKPSGEYCGGHAILAYGADPDWCYLQNSWGKGWGREGHCRISWPDLEFVFGEHGEAMAAVELPHDWVKPDPWYVRLWQWFLSLLRR